MVWGLALTHYEPVYKCIVLLNHALSR